MNKKSVRRLFGSVSRKGPTRVAALVSLTVISVVGLALLSHVSTAVSAQKRPRNTPVQPVQLVETASVDTMPTTERDTDGERLLEQE
ncbi:MAG: hypothetical protein JO314_10940, partial [Acidobacteria bacterium]|nr:hypothetical protein [Acidobacteriota bacterium]